MRRKLGGFEVSHGRQIGAALAQARARANLSASEIARASSVSLDAIRSVETGRVPTPGFLTVARLAGALGISLDDLHSQASASAVDGFAS
ncbi:MAG: helix-turn-helix transcriptional regulator [Mycobacterium kyogaense]